MTAEGVCVSLALVFAFYGSIVWVVFFMLLAILFILARIKDFLVQGDGKDDGPGDDPSDATNDYVPPCT